MSNKGCDYDNCVHTGRHCHIKGEVFILSDDEKNCSKCCEIYKTQKTLTKNQFEKEVSFKLDDDCLYRVQYAHCDKCHITYPCAFERDITTEIEYDCCFYNGNRKVEIVTIDHLCFENRLYITKGQCYSVPMLCSSKTCEFLCAQSSYRWCGSKNKDGGYTSSMGESVLAYTCFFCIWNPCYFYTIFSKYKKFDDKYEFFFCDLNYFLFHRVIWNNLPFYLFDKCLEDDRCFNMFVRNRFCMFDVLKKYDLEKLCDKCGDIVGIDYVHCKNCSIHYDNDKSRHRENCCSNFEKWQFHCIKCHKTYKDSNHCCKCEIHIDSETSHCCKCKNNYSKKLNHCAHCCITYEKNQDHCCKCEKIITYPNSHCNECCKIYNDKKNFHCNECHTCYIGLKHCPTCKNFSLPDSCQLCFEKLDGVNTKTTRCGHVFHLKCINDWVVENSKCPNCGEDHEYNGRESPFVMIPPAVPFGDI